MEQEKPNQAEQARAEEKGLLERTHLGRYLLETRNPVYSLLLLLPLLVAYESLALVINFQREFQVRNGADIIVRSVLRLFGIRSMFGFMMTVILATAVIVLVYYKRLKQPIRPKLFAYMFGESVLYGFSLGVVASRLSSFLLATGGLGNADLSTRLMVSLGAGVYEEIVFRVFLIWLLLGLFCEVLKMERVRGTATAVVLAALIFSGFHYVGALGDHFVWSSFVFRFMAGLVLSALYVCRGLGITAWAHSLYDVFLNFGWV